MRRRTVQTLLLTATLALAGAALATPPAPPGWAVVLEPGPGGDHWALVPIPSMGTPPDARPPDPAGWHVVSRAGRRGHSWVLVPAGDAGWAPGAPEVPASPDAPGVPAVPSSPPTPMAPPSPGEPPSPGPPGSLTPPQPAPFVAEGADDADLIELERRILDGINEARAEEGLPPLQPHPLLATAARGHSEEMATQGYFAHESPTRGRERFTDRLKAAGVSSFGAAAENIAKGRYPGDPADGIVESWLESPGHRANILSDRYVYTGVGVASRDGTLWSTQVFTSTLE